jgi:hypothetical protein
MNFITLAEAKDYLDVIHDADDSKLQMLLDAAHDEALQFMNREDFGDVCECSSSSSSEPVMPASVRLGVLILLQASYQASPDDAEQLRHVAEVKLMPYRCGLGV